MSATCRLGVGLLCLWVWLVALAATASAHEVRPALLSLQGDAGGYAVTWKQPVNAGRRLKLDPVFPKGCAPTEPVLAMEDGSVIERFRITCALDAGELRIDGLERTLTDVYVRITGADGTTRAALLKPADPSSRSDRADAAGRARLSGRGRSPHPVRLGPPAIRHRALPARAAATRLIGVATSFTLAHSLTLAAAALGVVALPSRPVEILIAASILLLAVEIVRHRRGESGLTARWPYLVSFGIGLIHGLGFAGALADLGLPRGEELLSLILFNVGVEAGQFAVILVALALGWISVRAAPRLARAGATLATYAIGITASYWLIERLAGYALRTV